MSGSRIGLTLDDKVFTSAVEKLGGVLKRETVRAIGVALVEVVNKRFEAGKDPWNRKWQALNPAYAAIKRGPGILRASLMLQRSVTFSASGNQVVIGSNRIYAGVQQFGATIKPVSARALVFRLGGVSIGPRGGKKTNSFFVRAKSVTIPPRPYLGFGEADRAAVREVLAFEIERAFSG